MVVDLVALAILLLFVLMGALRGGIATLTSLASLVLSYVAAVYAAQHLGAGAAEKLGIPPYLGMAAAGSVAFLGTAVFGGVVGMGVKRWAKSLRGDSSMGLFNRWLGAGVGAIRGGLVVVLLVWLMIWLDAARETGSFAGLDAVPDVASSSAAKLTEKAVETAVTAAMEGDEKSEDVLARFASRPGEAVRSLQSLLADRRIEALQQDRFFWTLIENGAYSRAMNRQSFQDIAKDGELRAKFASLGVVSDEAALDAAVFRESFGGVLEQVGPRVKGLVNDPDMERLAKDPAIVSMIETGDTIGLIRHEGVQQLVAKVSRGS